MSDALEYLQEIYGIGPVASKALLAKVRSSGKSWSNKKELFDILRERPMFETLPEAARAYLRYMPDRAIPHAVMRKFDVSLHRIKGIKFIIAGSYRRKKPISRDVDIVMIKRDQTTFSKFKTAIASLTGMKILVIYAEGPDKVSIMFRFTNNKPLAGEKKSYIIKADVFLTAPQDYMYTLLYATGSGAFNIRMRAQAKRRGYLLNQHGLFDLKSNTLVPINNEKELFERLGIAYRTPEERELGTKK